MSVYFEDRNRTGWSCAEGHKGMVIHATQKLGGAVTLCYKRKSGGGSPQILTRFYSTGTRLNTRNLIVDTTLGCVLKGGGGNSKWVKDQFCKTVVVDEPYSGLVEL